MVLSNRTHIARLVTFLLVAAVVASAAPAMASVIGEARGAGSPAIFTSLLLPAEESRDLSAKVPAVEADLDRALVARAQAPLPAPVATASTGARRSVTTQASGYAAPVTTDGGTRAASAAAVALNSNAPQPPAPAPAPTPVDNRLAEAQSILAYYAATYQHVAGTTIQFGDTRGNPQAIVYYQSKRIILNPSYTRSLETIIEHEIWHIIDWHSNGQINWGEQLPPSNANDYRL